MRVSRVYQKRCNSFKQNNKHRWLIFMFPIIGLLSLIWFLIRVVSKPSRSAYPCQLVAAPLASCFIFWIIGLVGSGLTSRKTRRLLRQSRYIVIGISAVIAIAALSWILSITGIYPAETSFVPTDLPNTPIGTAQGIHPGRVAWVHDPNATSWEGSIGSWRDDNNTDQNIVDDMLSKAIQCMTGESDDTDAWDVLFRYFNKTKGFGDIGYQQGEKIAIKLNMNQDKGSGWKRNSGLHSPHLVFSLLNQLINVAGVSGSAITLYDASRYIGSPIYDKVRSNPDLDFQDVKFVVHPRRTTSGRIGATPDTSKPIYTISGKAYLPCCVTQAKYIINMALLRPHTMFGVTLCAKNHFGSLYFTKKRDWIPSSLHIYGLRKRAMGSYNCLVDIMGHEHLGGRTLLYLIDGLYPAPAQGKKVIRFLPFGNDWCSSIFASQDPVAIDSVALDFLRNEPRCREVRGNVDNYLHEAAQANSPPSGTVYDPEGDGTQLTSLGVHEHWNNPVDKQYSRNLGTSEGIELVTGLRSIEAKNSSSLFQRREIETEVKINN